MITRPTPSWSGDGATSRQEFSCSNLRPAAALIVPRFLRLLRRTRQPRRLWNATGDSLRDGELRGLGRVKEHKVSHTAMSTDLRGSRARDERFTRSGRPEYGGWTDLELVAATETDLEAFGELIRRHQDFVFGAAMRIVRNPVLAQDVAQDAFVRAYKALGEFRGQAAVRSWLYRIATNLALNAVQRRKEYPSGDLPESFIETGPEREAMRDEMAAHLRLAIEELPLELRQPLVMREYGCLSYQEISDELELPLNTVRTRILRARRALRAPMEDWQ